MPNLEKFYHFGVCALIVLGGGSLARAEGDGTPGLADQVRQELAKTHIFSKAFIEASIQPRMESISIAQGKTISEDGDQGAQGEKRDRSSSNLWVIIHLKDKSIIELSAEVNTAMIETLYAISEIKPVTTVPKMQVDRADADYAMKPWSNEVAHIAVVKNPEFVLDLLAGKKIADEARETAKIYGFFGQESLEELKLHLVSGSSHE